MMQRVGLLDLSDDDAVDAAMAEWEWEPMVALAALDFSEADLRDEDGRVEEDEVEDCLPRVPSCFCGL